MMKQGLTWPVGSGLLPEDVRAGERHASSRYPVLNTRCPVITAVTVSG